MIGFGIDYSKPYQSIGLTALREMNRGIPRAELAAALRSMAGVVFEFDVSPARVSIPTHHFMGVR